MAVQTFLRIKRKDQERLHCNFQAYLICPPPTAPRVPVVVACPAVGGADDAHVEGVGGRAREDDGGPGADGGGGGDRGHGEAGGGLDQAQ